MLKDAAPSADLSGRPGPELALLFDDVSQSPQSAPATAGRVRDDGHPAGEGARVPLRVENVAFRKALVNRIGPREKD